MLAQTDRLSPISMTWIATSNANRPPYGRLPKSGDAEARDAGPHKKRTWRVSYSLTTVMALVLLAAVLSAALTREKTLVVEPLAALDAATAKKHAVVFVQLDWTFLNRERDFFREFARGYRRRHPFARVDFRIINFTDVSNGYAPLAKLPGWNAHDPGPRAHQINGHGEIIWLHKGRIVGIGKCNHIHSVEDAIAKTETYFKQ